MKKRFTEEQIAYGLAQETGGETIVETVGKLASRLNDGLAAFCRL